ncbi:alanine racemase [candidate division GN15 bacterium]|uniref:Alanine racemase n=1 Tax=candidate division GN15 bacterium TaxID=2072418 RepID=A0A855X7P0_9BACT|nr:MAG: alanine racemase [candidate division GN15 bacterium]
MKSPRSLQWIELSRSALYRNLDSLRRLAHGRIMAPSVKANAYGHGLSEITRMLSARKDVAYLSVHSLEEAIVCRQSGWKRKIMLLGPVALDSMDAVIKHKLEPVICSREHLEALGKAADKRRVMVQTHVKLETGTNRQGFVDKELSGVARIYKKHKYLGGPLGASTHFANIEDTTSHEYAQFQLDNFNRLTGVMTKLGIKPKLRHTASSAALILFDKTRFELVRPGLSTYGHWPSKETYLSYRLQGGKNSILSPVLSWKTRVTQIKEVPADSFIGYGCTYRTTAPTRLALLPIGYYDGYDRGLSNQAYVLIRGKRAPVRGRICMNLTMVDVTDIKGVRLEDEVTLIGTDRGETLSAEQLAQWAGTINYEILARLTPTAPRSIVR